MNIDGVKVDFYMADNVGQLSLTLGDIPAAKESVPARACRAGECDPRD